MANLEHLKILESGVTAWNKWRDDHPKIVPDLRGANLEAKNLSGINLENANLNSANLFLATLNHANCKKAKLQNLTLGLATLNLQICRAQIFGIPGSVNP